jgi:hypothetical protein
MIKVRQMSSSLYPGQVLPLRPHGPYALIGDQCRHEMRFPEPCRDTGRDDRGKLRDQGNRLCKMRKSRTVTILVPS